MRILWRAVVALVAIMTLAGCGLFGGGEEPSGGADAAGEAGGEATGAGAGPGEARVEELDLSTTLAEQTVKLPRHPEDSVEIGIQSLTVQDQVMVLRVLLTPRFTSGDEDVSPYEMGDTNSPRPTLVDKQNLKRYSVVSEGGAARIRKWETEPVLVTTKNGTTMAARYVFAAPQDAIDKVDVEFFDWAPPFLDVPITR